MEISCYFKPMIDENLHNDFVDFVTKNNIDHEIIPHSGGPSLWYRIDKSDFDKFINQYFLWI